MSLRTRVAVLAVAACGWNAGAAADSPSAPVQSQDAEYTRLINEYLVDKRITTELVDHMPASDSVPSPLRFLGRISGQPGELTYAADIERYYQELARTSPRVRFWKLGKTEEGRDQIVIAIADEAVLKDLDQHKRELAALGDPRRTTETQAQAIIKDGKPIYWITSGIHSPETGGPDAYYLARSPEILKCRRCTGDSMFSMTTIATVSASI